MRSHLIRLLALALVGGAVLVACGSDDEPVAAPCHDVLRHASYETLSQLAHAGLAADPGAIRDALPAAFSQVEDAPDDPSIDLPSYETFVTDFSDAEQATLLSALVSTQAGVGGVFDNNAFVTTVIGGDACTTES